MSGCLSSRGAWLSVLAGLWLCAPPPDAGSGMTSLARLEPVNEARLPEARTSILVYHRFGPVVADSMTVRTRTFRWQLEYLREHGYYVAGVTLDRRLPTSSDPLLAVPRFPITNATARRYLPAELASG